MKRIMLSIMFLLILCVSVAFAALSKTTTIVELDPWQEVAATTLVVGNAGNISDSYATILYLEVAYNAPTAQDGIDVIVEVSYGDDNWTLLTAFSTPAQGIQSTIFTNGAVTAGDSTVLLDDATAFLSPGTKWFFEDTTHNLSESVRTKSEDTNTVTLCHDLLRNHGDVQDVWAAVYEYIIPIPAAYAYVRVLIYNSDADANVSFTTRISKVTSL